MGNDRQRYATGNWRFRQNWNDMLQKMEETDKHIMLSNYEVLGQNWHKYRNLDLLKNTSCQTIAKTMQCCRILQIKKPSFSDYCSRIFGWVVCQIRRIGNHTRWIDLQIANSTNVHATVAKSYVDTQLQKFIRARIIRLYNSDTWSSTKKTWT